MKDISGILLYDMSSTSRTDADFLTMYGCVLHYTNRIVFNRIEDLFFDGTRVIGRCRELLTLRWQN